MKCQRCLGGRYLEVIDLYDGLILECLNCNHKINLDGTPLLSASGKRTRTPVYKKKIKTTAQKRETGRWYRKVVFS